MQRRTKRNVPMTKKMRTSHLFCRRIIIPIPTWGVFVVSAAAVIAYLAGPMLVTNIVSVVCVAISIILVTIARRQVNALRHDVHEALHNIGNDDEDDDEDQPYPVTEKVTLKKMKVNGTTSARVSEH
jgi:hypothetical protein